MVAAVARWRASSLGHLSRPRIQPSISATARSPDVKGGFTAGPAEAARTGHGLRRRGGGRDARSPFRAPRSDAADLKAETAAAALRSHCWAAEGYPRSAVRSTAISFAPLGRAFEFVEGPSASREAVAMSEPMASATLSGSRHQPGRPLPILCASPTFLDRLHVLPNGPAN